MKWLGLLALSALASAWMTGLLRGYAVRAGIIDRPNARSSHSNPTPRGGGLAIVAISLVGIAVLYGLRMVPLGLFMALMGGGLSVALVGFLDDRRPVSARIRFAVHLAAAIWALAWLGGFPLGNVLGVLGIVWVLNLFNFMDGIDGIAASEAIFVCCSAATLGVLAGATSAVPAVAAVIAATSCGFLLWNWPPAKIFMGDVGSGYLGYAIGVLAVAAGHESPTGMWVWLTLGGVFFVDATVTLVRRLIRGERVYEAHRSHAYQWMARTWGSHGRVTLTVTVLNIVWLLPWALLATLYREYALIATGAALIPLVALALAAGAGRAEAK